MEDKIAPLDEMLAIAYRYVSPYEYGSIGTVNSETYAHAALQGDVVDLKDWSAPYFIAKHLDDREIVYGSIPYLIGEAAKPIFRLNHRLNFFSESLPQEVRSSMQSTTHEDNVTVYTAPGMRFPDWFIHRQEELVKEALLLSGLHLRTLLDILKDKGNRPVAVYDYEGRPNTAVTGSPAGTVTLHKLCNMMMHHRYWVIGDQYVHDIFSDKQELESTALFGSKVNYAELLQTMIACLSEITVNNFVGVLRGRLIGLTIESSPREIMFATQNVHALGQIIGDRINDSRFGALQNFLFSALTEDERSQITTADQQDTITLVRHFGKPSFKVAEKLHEKRLTMSITINEKLETFQFDQAQFFDALTQAFGHDPVMTLDTLIERYDKPEVEVLA